MTSSGTYALYKATNRLNGKFYVGLTSRRLTKRWAEHVRHARYRVNKGSFYRAIRKHGPDVFDLVILETVLSWPEAKQREVALIAELKPAYNSTAGGDGTAGHRVTAEGRRRMSEVNRGNKHNLGRKWTEAQREHMREVKRGCPPPPASVKMEETRALNMRKAAAARRKPVRCKDDGAVYGSAREAAVVRGYHPNTVARACSTGLKVYGLTFEYVAGGP